MNKIVCTKGYEVQVLSCGAGYYIGTFDPEEGPNCRISNGYFKSREEGVHALASKSFANRCNAAENSFCHGGRGCCLHTEGED